MKISKKLFYSFIFAFIISAPVLAEKNTDQTIKLSISLDPALQNKLNPQHTLFVYARAAKGPRMPLSIVRHRAGELPLDTQLEASMAMMPQMSLTNFQQVILLARISASGNAMPQPGDLIGQIGPLNWQKLEKPVSININKQQ